LFSYPKHQPPYSHASAPYACPAIVEFGGSNLPTPGGSRFPPGYFKISVWMPAHEGEELRTRLIPAALPKRPLVAPPSPPFRNLVSSSFDSLVVLDRRLPRRLFVVLRRQWIVKFVAGSGMLQYIVRSPDRWAWSAGHFYVRVD
jgi:hypothetical protein